MPSVFNLRMRGQDEVRANLRAAFDLIHESLREGDGEIADHIVERAKLNAPILTGDLRSEIQRGPVNWTLSKIICVVEDDVDYAYKMHELLSPHGEYAEFHLGPVSQQQPPTEEGGVGGRYITRVADTHASRYENLLAEKVKQVLS